MRALRAGDTDAQTRKLLEQNNNYNTAFGQITIIKQELVPALMVRSCL